MFSRSTPLGTVATWERLSLAWVPLGLPTSTYVRRMFADVLSMLADVLSMFADVDSRMPTWIHVCPWCARHRLGMPMVCTSPARDAHGVHHVGT
jgi:hypothetical protein